VISNAPMITVMRFQNKSSSWVLAFAAMIGMLLPGQGAVFCLLADEALGFELACDVSADGQRAIADTSDGHGAHCAFASNSHEQIPQQMADDCCFYISVQVITGVNIKSRRESLWAGLLGSFQLLAYLDAHCETSTERRFSNSLDDRQLMPGHIGLLRTVVLLI